MDNLKFLIVEDDFYIARNLKKQINQIGYEVTTIASNSFQAIKSFNNNRPDFVIMDIELTDSREAGIELAKIFKSRNKDLIIIYYTSLMEEDDLMQKAIETLSDGILSKGTNLNELKVNINNSIRKRTQALQEESTIRKDDTSFWIKSSKKIYKRIFFDDICWFQTKDKMVNIYTDSKKTPTTFSSTLNYLEEQLNVFFFVRTSQSYTININKSFDLNRNNRTIMVSRESEEKGAIEIPISDKYFDNLLKSLNIIKTR